MNKNSRRPLKVRELKIVQSIATKLSKSNITPNKISIISILFALAAAVCLAALPFATEPQAIMLPLLAVFFIQCRLLCNLFDGLVAVEGNKGTPSGELYNDIPDRIADPLIIVATGYACSSFMLAVEIAWLSGILAIFTAYVRTLAASIGAPVDFCGPFAKQQRMATISISLTFAAFDQYFLPDNLTLYIGLILTACGTGFTIIRRTKRAYIALERLES